MSVGRQQHDRQRQRNGNNDIYTTRCPRGTLKTFPRVRGPTQHDTTAPPHHSAKQHNTPPTSTQLSLSIPVFVSLSRPEEIKVGCKCTHSNHSSFIAPAGFRHEKLARMLDTVVRVAVLVLLVLLVLLVVVVVVVWCGGVGWVRVGGGLGIAFQARQKNVQKTEQAETSSQRALTHTKKECPKKASFVKKRQNDILAPIHLVIVVLASPTAPSRRSLPEIEAHPQFARRLAVVRVHARPLSPPVSSNTSGSGIDSPMLHSSGRGQCHLDGVFQNLRHWRTLDGRLLHSLLRDHVLPAPRLRGLSAPSPASLLGLFPLCWYGHSGRQQPSTLTYSTGIGRSTFSLSMAVDARTRDEIAQNQRARPRLMAET